jgi:hypothetical protein
MAGTEAGHDGVGSRVIGSDSWHDISGGRSEFGPGAHIETFRNIWYH